MRWLVFVIAERTSKETFVDLDFKRGRNILQSGGLGDGKSKPKATDIELSWAPSSPISITTERSALLTIYTFAPPEEGSMTSDAGSDTSDAKNKLTKQQDIQTPSGDLTSITQTSRITEVGGVGFVEIIPWMNPPPPSAWAFSIEKIGLNFGYWKTKLVGNWSNDSISILHSQVHPLDHPELEADTRRMMTKTG